MVRDVTGDELGSGRVGVEAAGMRDAFVKQGVGVLVIAVTAQVLEEFARCARMSRG